MHDLPQESLHAEFLGASDFACLKVVRRQRMTCLGSSDHHDMFKPGMDMVWSFSANVRGAVQVQELEARLAAAEALGRGFAAEARQAKNLVRLHLGST